MFRVVIFFRVNIDIIIILMIIFALKVITEGAGAGNTALSFYVCHALAPSSVGKLLVPKRWLLFVLLCQLLKKSTTSEYFQ